MSGMDVDKVDVTVVGGHAGTTIMPLLSQVGCSLIHLFTSLHLVPLFLFMLLLAW